MQTASNVGLRKGSALSESAKSSVRGMAAVKTIRQLRALETLRTPDQLGECQFLKEAKVISHKNKVKLSPSLGSRP
jgi:hypothetical protein